MAVVWSMRLAKYVGPVFSFCDPATESQANPYFCVQWQVVDNALTLVLEAQASGWIGVGMSATPSMLGRRRWSCSVAPTSTPPPPRR